MPTKNIKFYKAMILKRYSIVYLAKLLNIDVKPSRRSKLIPCPFHEEIEGSFSLYEEGKKFKCFGCGKGGNVIDFLMAEKELSFKKAVEWFVDKFGLEDKKKRLGLLKEVKAIKKEVYKKTGIDHWTILNTMWTRESIAFRRIICDPDDLFILNDMVFESFCELWDLYKVKDKLDLLSIKSFIKSWRSFLLFIIKFHGMKVNYKPKKREPKSSWVFKV